MTRQRSLYYEHIQNSNELAQSLIIDFLSHWSSSLLLHRSTPHSLVSNSGTSKNPIVHYFLLTFFSFLLLTQISSVLFCSALSSSPSSLLFAGNRNMCRRLSISCFSYTAGPFAGADGDVIESGARWNDQLLQLLLEGPVSDNILVQPRPNWWGHRYKRVGVIVIVPIAKCEVISFPPLLSMLFRRKQCDRNAGYLLGWQSDGSSACACAIACPTATDADWRGRGEGPGWRRRGGRLTA